MSATEVVDTLLYADRVILVQKCELYLHFITAAKEVVFAFVCLFVCLPICLQDK